MLALNCRGYRLKYGVRLQGENYELNFEGEVELLGFVTTIFVKASSPEEAELRAVELVRNDKRLNGLMISGSKFLSSIHLTEVWTESWWKRLGGKGYTFFPMASTHEI